MAHHSLCSPKPSNFNLSTIIKSPQNYTLTNRSYRLRFPSLIMHKLIVIKQVQLRASMEPNHGDHKVVSSDNNTNPNMLELQVQPCKNNNKRNRGIWGSMILLAVPFYEKVTNGDEVTKTLGSALEAIEAFARMVEQICLEMEKLPNGTLKCEALHMRHLSEEIITYVGLAENFIRKVDEILMVWNKT